MKTLLLFGSSRMSAFCPHCDHLLEHRPGEAPETVLPFFGAVGAGKTRLLFSIVTLLQAWDAAGELAAGFADSVTTRELAAAEETLRSGASTWATPPELPRAHLIRLRAGKDTRVLHMFDAAGERFYRASRTQELGFLGTAKTFVLVIDPLSVESFWTRLTAGRPGDAMPRVRSAPPSPDLAFNQAVQSIEAMRGSLKGARIAVVFSKADQYDAPPDVAEWAERELGLGNLVRAVQLQFEGHFIFMCAAAVMTGGAMHPSVARLLRWMLADEGISLPGSGP